MITSKIAANQAFGQLNRLQRTEGAAERPGEGSGDKVRTARGENVDGVKADLSPIGVNRWQHFNAEFNAVVRSIRIADQAMGEIEDRMGQMVEDVATYVKQYPPYPPGSEERAELLNRFAGLRQMVDRLTVPPDPYARQILGGAESSGEGDDWRVRIGGRDLGAVIRRQPIHSGAAGLSLPALPENAGDKEIEALGGVLAKARQTLKARRAALAEDAIQAIRAAESEL